MFESLDRRPLREEIYSILKKAILYGKIQPGRMLFEDKLAEELGTSRTPIREAILKIEQEGLVTRLPRGGFSVTELSVREVEEIFDLMSLLEVYAGMRAMDRCTSEDTRALETNVMESERALSENRIDDLIRLNTEFHNIFYRASNSKRLRSLIRQLEDQITQYRAQVFHLDGRGADSIQDHKNMILCLKKRNRIKLRRAIQEHVQIAKRILAEILRENGGDMEDGELLLSNASPHRRRIITKEKENVSDDGDHLRRRKEGTRIHSKRRTGSARPRSG
jgi:DNA-binding GntR family transcriptional regulator